MRLFFEWDPLVAVANALASHALYRGLLWSLVILLPTLFLGRFFCGWICPMGTLQHFVGNMPSESKRGKQRIESNRYKRWQTVKYVVLIAGLVAAFFGSMAIGWLDPFSLLVRSIGLAILPAFNLRVRAVLMPLEHSHVAAIKATGETLHTILQATVLDFRQTHFAQGLVLGVLFLADSCGQSARDAALVPLDLPAWARCWVRSRAGRFWGCTRTRPACDKCNRCLLHCQGGDDPIGGAPWRKSECLMCMNCVGSCPHDSLDFRFFRKEREVASPDIGRRKALTGLAAGAAVVPLMRANTGLGKSRHERLLRPPGALDEDGFSFALHPLRRVHEGVPQQFAASHARSGRDLKGCGRRRWCRASAIASRVACCALKCAPPAPSGRSRPKEKGWVVGSRRSSTSQPIRLGTAFYDRGRCLPWAEATECIVCEEWCPVSPKAIYVEEAEVIDSAGNTKTLKQPRVDPSRCVGCGACEYACPLQERPAVYVTSIGESRSPSSQILLNRN